MRLVFRAGDPAHAGLCPHHHHPGDGIGHAGGGHAGPRAGDVAAVSAAHRVAAHGVRDRVRAQHAAAGADVIPVLCAAVDGGADVAADDRHRGAGAALCRVLRRGLPRRHRGGAPRAMGSGHRLEHVALAHRHWRRATPGDPARGAGAGQLPGGDVQGHAAAVGHHRGGTATAKQDDRVRDVPVHRTPDAGGPAVPGPEPGGGVGCARPGGPPETIWRKAMSASLNIRNLHKRYGELEVLRGINLEIPAGQTVAVIGPSGSGKSTLLRVLMTLDQPTSGDIEIDGQSMWKDEQGLPGGANSDHLRRVRGKIGMVFQHFNLFPHMTALGNAMEAPVHVLGMPKDQARERAVEYLDMVGRGDKLDVYPAQLSGGQKQRVGIARALAMCPEIMLFDEVTSALDPELVGGILQILRDLSARRSMTMIIVTHQMKFAERSSARTLFFDEGNIVEDAESPVLFSQPKEARTRQFLDSVIEGQ
ncbi:hypothetical protein G6F65_013917 [Rhizopus arrhizus]|nr:hypothetical protein G6F65_013917 [Rhizopus arrhizus]